MDGWLDERMNGWKDGSMDITRAVKGFITLEIILGM
jgi:hypothetical protein